MFKRRWLILFMSLALACIWAVDFLRAQEVCVIQQRDFSTSLSYSRNVAQGDLNGDSIQDLVILGTEDAPKHDVQILLGQGDGSFVSHAQISLGEVDPASRDLVVGDLNGDSVLDLAFAGLNTYNVLVTRGNGDGTFGPIQSFNFPVGQLPFAIAMADFNNDSKLDLATANDLTDNISVLINNTPAGASTFSFLPASNFAVGSRPRDLAVGKFDNDVYPDIAVANYNSNTISILLGVGGSTFQLTATVAVGVAPNSIAVGKFRSQSNSLDLVVANEGGNTVSVLLGDGFGGFQAAIPRDYTVGTSPYFVTVGDFNNDAFLDIAVTNRNSNNVSILKGNDNGTFATAQNFAVCSGPWGITVGDFNRDGQSDLAVACRNVLYKLDILLLGTNINSVVQWKKDYVYTSGQLTATVEKVP